jgi:hypothetical protein
MFSLNNKKQLPCLVHVIVQCAFLWLVFPNTASAVEQKRYEVGVDEFGLGYSTYQNGSPPDSESWSGPALFFTYHFSDFWSLKTSYYALSTEGYDMIDTLPWRTLKKMKGNDMNGVQAALRIGRELYGTVGIYKNFKDFLFVVDKQGLLFSMGLKVRKGNWLIDVSPFGFHLPVQKEGTHHISHTATLGISYIF